MNTTYGIILVNSANQILSCHPTRHDWNQWDIPKGGKDAHETPTDALYREFYEETGYGLNSICTKVIDISQRLQKTYKYNHKEKELYGFFGVLTKDIDISLFKCHSFVRDFNELPPFPEIDAYSWLEYADIGALHESQHALVEDINTEFGTFTNVNKESVPKSEIYG